MKGLWNWPEDADSQVAALKKLDHSETLRLLTLIAESKEGLSNAEVDRITNKSSEWQVVPLLQQLISIGAIEYHTTLFGNPGKYEATEFGRSLLQKIRGAVITTTDPPRQV